MKSGKRWAAVVLVAATFAMAGMPVRAEAPKTAAPKPSGAAPAPAATSKVCNLTLYGNLPSSGEGVLALANEKLTTANCKAGDIVRMVSERGLAWNIVPEAVCDYRSQILLRPDSGLSSMSCVYVGYVRGST